MVLNSWNNFLKSWIWKQSADDKIYPVGKEIKINVNMNSNESKPVFSHTFILKKQKQNNIIQMYLR